MRRGILGLTAAVFLGLCPAAFGSGHMATARACGSLQTRTGPYLNKFTRIEHKGVSCRRAREVVETFGTQGSANGDLGFSCSTFATGATGVGRLTCVRGKKRVTARVTNKTA
jgi:hypothetical protein